MQVFLRVYCCLVLFVTSVRKTLKVGKDGKAKVVIQPKGGIIIR